MNPELKAELEAIYAKIPEMECVPGCSCCCGPTWWLPVEADNIREYLKEHNMRELRARSLLCPYFDVEQGKCSIYPVRPVVCRLYGVVEKNEDKLYDMTCHFVDVEIKLTDAEATAILQEINHLRVR